MHERTETEWRELARRLREIADDPEEEKDRRQRALAIIETIPKEFQVPRRSTTSEHEVELGQII